MNWDDLSWEAKRGAVLSEALFQCQICHEAQATEVDHIWPRSKGGSDGRRNLRATCRPCNRSKSQRVLAVDMEHAPDLILEGTAFYAQEAASALRLYIFWSVMHRVARSGFSILHAQDDFDGKYPDVAEQLLDDVQHVADRVIDDLTPPHPAADVIHDIFDLALGLAEDDQ